MKTAGMMFEGGEMTLGAERKSNGTTLHPRFHMLLTASSDLFPHRQYRY